MGNKELKELKELKTIGVEEMGKITHYALNNMQLRITHYALRITH